ncbi:nuclease-related domain-containing protein [Nocardioides sp. C4-1]|uniref:nuclease-related domain-containing protein n=1 Tax=Nocardioides sp. C4-1 TaxID=3151851 RepID=UPI003265E03F
MSESTVPPEKRMRLRYAGACRECAAELAQGTSAIYERATKTVRCLDCSAPSTEPASTVAISAEPTPAEPLPEVDSGVAGASARREFERRKARREAKIRSDHKRLGGLILAVTDDPQSTRAWDTGALGEERLGARLNTLADDHLRVLHDRRIPGTRANIDHIAVTRNGIYVIDAKKYQGRPTLAVEGGLIRPRVEKLMVGRRDCTKLVDGVLKQVDVVRGVLGDAGKDVEVRGVLCFVEADWPLIGGSFSTRGVDVCWPKKLYPRLRAEGAISIERVADLHRSLAAALPPA